MGISYEDLRDKGKRIIFQSQESLVIERNSKSFTKRRYKIVKEKYLQQAERAGNSREQWPSEYNIPGHRQSPRGVQKQPTASKKDLPKYDSSERGFNVKSKKNCYHCQDASAVRKERHSKASQKAGVNSAVLENKTTQHYQSHLDKTSRHLFKVEQAINREIAKLKQHRSSLQKNLKEKMQKEVVDQKSSTIWADKLAATKQTPSRHNHDEITVGQYAKKPTCVCNSPRYGTNEDLAIRPKTRGVALQMPCSVGNTTGYGAFEDHISKFENKKSLRNCELKKTSATVDKKPIGIFFDDGTLSGQQQGQKPSQHYTMNAPANGIVGDAQTYYESEMTSGQENNYNRKKCNSSIPASQYNTTDAVGVSNQRPCAICSDFEDKPGNNGPRGSDLITQPFYCCKPERSPSKSNSPVLRKFDEDTLKNYELALKSHLSKENSHKAEEHNLRQKRECQRDQRANDFCTEKMKKTNKSAKSHKTTERIQDQNIEKFKKREKSANDRREIFDDEWWPQNDDILVQLLGLDEKQECPRNLKHQGKAEMVQSSSTATYTVKSQQVTATSTKSQQAYDNCSPSFQTVQGYTTETSVEPQYTRETLSMLKKMKIFEYKPMKPRTEDFDNEKGHLSSEKGCSNETKPRTNDFDNEKGHVSPGRGGLNETKPRTKDHDKEKGHVSPEMHSLNEPLRKMSIDEKVQLYREYIKQYQTLDKNKELNTNPINNRTLTKERKETFGKAALTGWDDYGSPGEKSEKEDCHMMIKTKKVEKTERKPERSRDLVKGYGNTRKCSYSPVQSKNLGCKEDLKKMEIKGESGRQEEETIQGLIPAAGNISRAENNQLFFYDYGKVANIKEVERFREKQCGNARNSPQQIEEPKETNCVEAKKELDIPKDFSLCNGASYGQTFERFIHESVNIPRGFRDHQYENARNSPQHIEEPRGSNCVEAKKELDIPKDFSFRNRPNERQIFESFKHESGKIHGGFKENRCGNARNSPQQIKEPKGSNCVEAKKEIAIPKDFSHFNRTNDRQSFERFKYESENSHGATNQLSSQYDATAKRYFNVEMVKQEKLLDIISRNENREFLECPHLSPEKEISRIKEKSSYLETKNTKTKLFTLTIADVSIGENLNEGSQNISNTAAKLRKEENYPLYHKISSDGEQDKYNKDSKNRQKMEAAIKNAIQECESNEKSVGGEESFKAAAIPKQHHYDKRQSNESITFKGNSPKEIDSFKYQTINKKSPGRESLKDSSEIESELKEEVTTTTSSTSTNCEFKLAMDHKEGLPITNVSSKTENAQCLPDSKSPNIQNEIKQILLDSPKITESQKSHETLTLDKPTATSSPNTLDALRGLRDLLTSHRKGTLQGDDLNDLASELLTQFSIRTENEKTRLFEDKSTSIEREQQTAETQYTESLTTSKGKIMMNHMDAMDMQSAKEKDSTSPKLVNDSNVDNDYLTKTKEENIRETKLETPQLSNSFKAPEIRNRETLNTEQISESIKAQENLDKTQKVTPNTDRIDFGCPVETLTELNHTTDEIRIPHSSSEPDYYECLENVPKLEHPPEKHKAFSEDSHNELFNTPRFHSEDHNSSNYTNLNLQNQFKPQFNTQGFRFENQNASNNTNLNLQTQLESQFNTHGFSKNHLNSEENSMNLHKIPTFSSSKVSHANGSEYLENKSNAAPIDLEPYNSAVPWKGILKPGRHPSNCQVTEEERPVPIVSKCESEVYETISVVSMGQEDYPSILKGSIISSLSEQKKLIQHSEQDQDGSNHQSRTISAYNCGKNVLNSSHAYPCLESRQTESPLTLSCKPRQLKQLNTKSPQSSLHDKIPKFTNCPCMLDTYLKIVNIYLKGKDKKDLSRGFDNFS